MLYLSEWSRETLLESWMKDPIVCCEKSGVAPPSCIYDSMAAAPPADLSTTIQSDNVPSSEITVDNLYYNIQKILIIPW